MSNTQNERRSIERVWDIERFLGPWAPKKELKETFVLFGTREATCMGMGIVVLVPVCSLKSTNAGNGVPCCFLTLLATDALVKCAAKAPRLPVVTRALFTAP
jgi:hypothetical protein